MIRKLLKLALPALIGVLGIASAFAQITVNDSSPAQIEFLETATVSKTTVSLGDVANLANLPDAWRDKARHIVVATLPSCCEIQTLPIAQLARTARLQLPGITRWLNVAALDGRSVAVAVHVRDSSDSKAVESARHIATCMRIRRPVAAGAAIRIDDIDAVPSACTEGDVHRVTYSRDTHVVRAPHALSSGDYVIAPPLAALARVRHGDSMTTTITIGNVTIHRDLIAARDQAAGHDAVMTLSQGERS
jgi:hypothetical protein